MMLERILLVIFFVLVHSSTATAYDITFMTDGEFFYDCDTGGNWGSCNNYLTEYDGTECLSALTGKSFREFHSNLGGIIKSYKIQTKKKYGFWNDTWAYRIKDGVGVSGECRTGMPSFGERMYIKRTTKDLQTAKYRINRDYCSIKRVLPFYSDAVNSCDWFEDDNDIPNDTRWGDGYSATFSPHEVKNASAEDPAGKKILRGIAWGHHVCLKRYTDGDKYLHSESKHVGKKNSVCGYVVLALIGDRACNSPFGSWEGALIGCVDEPLLHGPDVFNKVIPTELVPFVDSTICMDPKGGDNRDKKCDKSKRSYVERGSTFDKPMIVLTDGKGHSGDNILELRYQFYATDYDPGIKTCGKMNLPGFERVQYCAQVFPDNPGKVCACKKGTASGGTIYNPYNFCGENPIIDCVDRPTMEHSKLTYHAKATVYKDPLTDTPYPAAELSIVEADASGKLPQYLDSSGRAACLGSDGVTYYRCDSNNRPTSTKSSEPLRFKRRLAVPSGGNTLREYIPKTVIDPYATPYSVGKANCKDNNNKDVYYGTDGKFYLLNSSGKTTSSLGTTPISCKVGSKTLTGGQTAPLGYIRDTQTYYGVDFTTIIPEFDSSSNILLGRYTTRYDEVPTNQECTPVRLAAGGLCDPKGHTSFYPGGNRDTTYCPIMQDQSSAQCTGLGKGYNDPKAMRLFCPGVMLRPNSSSGSKICLEGSAKDWLYKTINDYYDYKSGKTPTDTFLTRCSNPSQSNHCSSITGAITIPAIDTPSQSSGWATWPSGKLGETQTGTCSDALGYTNRKTFSAFNYTKEQVCAVPTPVSGIECDSKFTNYDTVVKPQLTTTLRNKAKTIADTQERNLSQSEIVEEFPSDYPYTVDVVDGVTTYYRWWYVSNLPPKRTIDQYGNATIENPCVKK